MIKDRAQKATALKFCISKRWLPQIEVDIGAKSRIEKSKYLLTDLDVLAISLNPVGEQIKLIFDCKSGARESAIARVFWLHGVMAKVNSSHGFVIMGAKVKLSKDHRLSAAELGVSLLQENEFHNLALGLNGTINISRSYSVASDIGSWEKFFAIEVKYPAFTDYLDFSTSTFWILKDAGEQCRKIVAKLRSIRTELDPSKAEHLAIFGDALCLFLCSISNLANRLFLVLMHPTKKEEFSSLLLAFLYGGYENLQTALKIRKLATGASSEDIVSIFPDTDRFEQLVREIMQAPQQALPSALLAREMSLCCLDEVPSTELQYSISKENPYSSKFLLLGAEYLQKAIKLPQEFSQKYSENAFNIMSQEYK